MTHTAACHDTGPIALRYPRGNGTGVALPAIPERLAIGKGRIVRGPELDPSKHKAGKIAILSLGTRLAEALKAADTLEAKGLATTVADLRFAKPLDEALITKLMATHEVIVTIEEGSIGGLGAHVLTLASDEGLTDGDGRTGGLKIRTMRLPDLFQDHDSPDKQYDTARLNAPHIVETVLKALRWNEAGMGGAEAQA
jgi:1-deoxy-D-xylulose-5-phosphate synthase